MENTGAAPTSCTHAHGFQLFNYVCDNFQAAREFVGRNYLPVAAAATAASFALFQRTVHGVFPLINAIRAGEGHQEAASRTMYNAADVATVGVGTAIAVTNLRNAVTDMRAGNVAQAGRHAVLAAGGALIGTVAALRLTTTPEEFVIRVSASGFASA